MPFNNSIWLNSAIIQLYGKKEKGAPDGNNIIGLYASGRWMQHAAPYRISFTDPTSRNDDRGFRANHGSRSSDTNLSRHDDADDYLHSPADIYPLTDFRSFPNPYFGSGIFSWITLV